MNKFKDFLEVLIPLSQKLEKNISVIPSTTDPEIVHGCRVAVRSMRGILKFYGKKGKKLDDSLKKIGDSLGKMRDLEVQIMFFKDQQKRYELENIYEEKLYEWDLEKLHVIGNIPEFNGKKFIKKCKKMFDDEMFSAFYSYFHLERGIGRILDNLDEEIKEETGLHLLRIKLKKVRYILEALSYRDAKYWNYINDFKYFQDLLGDIHDYFVIQEEMVSKDKEAFFHYIQSEKNKRIKEFKENYPRLLNLLEDILNYAGKKAFPDYKGTSEEIRNLIFDYKEKRERIKRVAQSFSPDFAHVQRVENRCRALLQKLGKIEKIEGYDLFILDSAALLHDIGHRVDPKKHNIYSKRMVEISKYLPLGREEREKIGWLVKSHRGEVKNRKKEDKTTRILCGVLRAVDGMDMESLEYVKDFGITDKKDRLIFNLGQVSPALKKRFLKKSKFLGEILKRKIEVH